MIKIYDVSDQEKYNSLTEESSKRGFMLMEEDYIELVFKTRQKKAFALGDYINHERYGRFELTTIQKPKFNPSTMAYEYTLRFNAPYMKWKNKKYKFSPSSNRHETSFSLTEGMTAHMNILVNNLSYHGWQYTWKYEGGGDEEVISSSKYITFANVSIYEALTKIAEAFEIEWWISDNIIHLGRVEIGYLGSPIEFEIGKNVADIDVNDSQGDDYFNVFTAFGSDRNLPFNYRKTEEGSDITYGVVQKRLMLPKQTPLIYLDGVSSSSPEEEKVEGIVVFDDIFPKTAGEIKDVTSFEKQVEVEDPEAEGGTRLESVKFFRFTDKSLKFDEDYILPTQALQVTFSSGNLAGMTFDVVFNPLGVSKTEDGYQMFEIVRNENYGIPLPVDNYKPKSGDKYTLIGFDATKLEDLELVDAAEKELLKRAQAYAKKLQIDPNNYACTMLADYMYGRNASGELDRNFGRTFSLGDVISLKDSNLFESGSRQSRVIGYEYRLDEPYNGAVITIGENATYSRSSAMKGEIDGKIENIAYGTNENSNTTTKVGGNNIYIITSHDNTAETDKNVYSASRTKQEFANKRKNDLISALWTFSSSTQKRGIQSQHYSNEGNEDNLFGKGFELVQKTNGNGNSITRLEVDELLVRMRAVFASLEIRKMAYVGGNFVFSSAGGRIYHVVSMGSFYRCYLYSDDGTTSTTNSWDVDDQALCQTFDIESGVHDGARNKRYWRRVVATGKEQISGKLNEDGTQDDTQYQYIDLSKYDCELGSDTPEVDDTIVQFGNWTNESRQGVIYIMVTGENAPALIEYSNVGRLHFVWPEPDTQISPRGGNIFKGKFYSVVDGTGNSMTIEEQINSLLRDYEDIRNQADQKMEVWFNAGTPLPSESDLLTYNTPAEDWATEADKMLHIGDLYYDTAKEPGSSGGRAYRWHRNGTNFFWLEVTDQDTIAALEKAADLQDQIDDIVSDGIISKGAEKSQLLIEWNSAVSSYKKGKEEAERYELIKDDAWNQYERSFIRVFSMLDGADIKQILLYPPEMYDNKLPAWLADLYEDTILANTHVETAEYYRSVWKEYYDSFSAWNKRISVILYDKSEDLQEQVDSIVADGIISKGSEKSKLLLEWNHAVASYTYNREEAVIYGQQGSTQWNNYKTSFLGVGTMLNNGTSFTESMLNTIPSWISDLAIDTVLEDTPTKNADIYRSVWKDYYEKLSVWEEHVSYVVHEKAEDLQGQVNDIVNDGIISKGSEKSQLLLEWSTAVSIYNNSKNEATNYNLIDSTKWNNYKSAFLNVGTMLNNGTTFTEAKLGTTPSWLSDIVVDTILGDTPTQNAETYRSVWKNYYEKLSAWNEHVSYVMNDIAESLQSQVDDIVNDSIISKGSEKSKLLLEWNTAVSSYANSMEEAVTYGLTESQIFLDFEVSFFRVGTMLDNGNTNSTLTFNRNNYTKTPTWLGNIYEDTKLSQTPTQNANSYRLTWKNYYECLAEWNKHISEVIHEKAEGLQGQVDSIVSDGVINKGTEKSQLLLEWSTAIANYSNNKKEAEKYGLLNFLEWTNYKTSFFSVGKMLNDGDADSMPTITKDNFEKTLSWFSSMNSATTLANTPTKYKTNYRLIWKYYYECLSALSTQISTVIPGNAATLQEQICNFASDGIISVSEKSQLLAEWNSAVSSYKTNKEEAENQNLSKTSKWLDYEEAFFSVGTMLDNGCVFTEGNLEENPSWLNKMDENTILANTPTKDAEKYRSVWKCYYECLSAFEVYTSEVPKEAERLIALTQLGTAYNDLYGDYAKDVDPPIIYIEKSVFASTHVNVAGSIWFDGVTASINTTGVGGWNNPFILQSSHKLYIALRSAYNTIGDASIRVYASAVSNANEYDLALRKVSYNDPFSGKTLTGPCEILGCYDGKWQVLQKSIMGVIENLGEQLRLIVYGSDGKNEVDTSGLVTTSKFNELFSKKITIDANGNVTNFDKSGLVTASNFASLLSQSITINNGKVTNIDTSGLVSITEFSEELFSVNNAISYITGQIGQCVKVTSFAGLFANAVNEDGNIVKQADISAFITEDEVNGLISNIRVSADKIALEGLITANSNFKVLSDGSIEAKNAKISGYIYGSFIDLSQSDAIREVRDGEYWYKINTNLYISTIGSNIILPVGDKYVGARVIIYDTFFYQLTRTTIYPTRIIADDNSQISGECFVDIEGSYDKTVQGQYNQYDAAPFKSWRGLADYIDFSGGVIELSLQEYKKYEEVGGSVVLRASRSWVVLNCSVCELSFKDSKEDSSTQNRIGYKDVCYRYSKKQG